MGLAVTVCLYDEHRELHAFGPGADVPEWAREQITNPAAWEQGKHALSGAPDGDANDHADHSHIPTTGISSGSADGPPPQDGPAASRAVWEEYATTHGVTVEPDWKRGDIIAACERAGVPV